MSNKHKYYDVIVAWASGEKIQFKLLSEDWKDYEQVKNCYPAFNEPILSWRVKPNTITKKYRMALFSDGNVVAYDVTNSYLDDPIEYKLAGFIRWVGDIAEVEIDV